MRLQLATHLQLYSCTFRLNRIHLVQPQSCIKEVNDQLASLTVMRSIWINATLERAWRAVTEAEQLSKWYAPGSPWEIPLLTEGEKVYFHHSPNEHHAGTEVVTMAATIEQLEPLRVFAVRWDDEPTMLTSFLLAEEDGGTRVTISETGYETAAQMEGTATGYGMSMENLRDHLEGRSLPY